MKHNRIPPYGMAYEVAQKRNALPVPDSQYGKPGPGGTYDYCVTGGWHPSPGSPPRPTPLGFG